MKAMLCLFGLHDSSAIRSSSRPISEHTFDVRPRGRDVFESSFVVSKRGQVNLQHDFQKSALAAINFTVSALRLRRPLLSVRTC